MAKLIDEGQGPFTEPRAKDDWFEEVGNRQSNGPGVCRSILCCLGEARKICSRGPAFVLPPVVGVNRFIYCRNQAI